MDRSALRAKCVLVAVSGALLLAPGACGLFKKKPTPAPRVSSPTSVRSVPTPLRGTIGAEARIIGNEATLVSGIGFVVGLDGTGGLPIPEQYAAHLEREMGLNGVGIANDDRNSPLQNMSPRQLLRDENTAAVFVQAAIPPGATSGDGFDVYIRAINATSLEGGKLWTTELRIGPPSAFGDPQARILARAKGPIFLNPFTEQGEIGTRMARNVGRVLDGGLVTDSTKIQIILDTPSHQRVRQMASALNSAFPLEIGARDQTARGVDDTQLLVRVPAKYKDRRNEFLQLITHTTIDQSYPDVYAQRYAGTMETQPYLANEMAWCLQALGPMALPYIRAHYDHPEAAPRLSALRTGANLNDPTCIEQLKRLAINEESALQIDAIRLLSMIDGSVVPDRTLRTLLGSDQLSVRVEAYEGLVSRAINAQKRRIVENLTTRQRATELSGTEEQQIDVLARVRLSNDPIRGISRELVGGKFFLDTVPFGDPLIYVTQQREPRVVVFGADQEVETPLLAAAWTDRLMLAADAPGDPVRLYYRNERERKTYTHPNVPSALPGLVQFLAMDPTPGSTERGVGLSYSETVSALFQMHQDLIPRIGFTTERDQLLAELLKTSQPEDIEVRPEGPESDTKLVPLDDPRQTVIENEARPVRRTLLVPLNPVPDEPEDNAAPKPIESRVEPIDDPGSGAARPE